jgi:DNA-binding HxlR family transcriptional regulator
MKLEECPVRRTMKFIGGKWKPIILFYLKEGTKRSAELSRRIPEASPKVLTEQLRELERDGLIQREIFPTVPAKVQYSLTERGNSLQPVLQAMCDWARKIDHGDKPRQDVPHETEVSFHG